MKVKPEFDGLDCEFCELSACIVQGGVHSTYCWNALIGYLIQLLLPMWEQRRYGFDLDEAFDDVEEGLINHTVWSDNVWLIGKDEKEIAMMVTSLTQLMNYYGLRWKNGSTKILASGGYDISGCEPLKLTVDGTQWRSRGSRTLMSSELVLTTQVT